jgi:hypothetical protein
VLIVFNFLLFLLIALGQLAIYLVVQVTNPRTLTLSLLAICIG